MQATFNVYRKEPGSSSKPGRSTHTVEVAEDATVMDALLKIRDEQDPTLGFRASCLKRLLWRLHAAHQWQSGIRLYRQSRGAGQEGPG